jgi:tryptophanase
MHEPYRIKVVESLPRVSRKDRQRALSAAGYNTFHLPADRVEIDLVSDSGTGAMSSAQWAAMADAREDFSGQACHERFVSVARDVFGFDHVQPVHQGRAAESLLFRLLVRPRDVVLSNTFFETTRANVEACGGEARDLPDSEPPWCGNIDLDRLERTLRRNRRVRLVVLTVTSNIAGGQPVAIDNLRRTRELVDEHSVLLALDASRFAGNAGLVKQLTGSRMSVKRLCREIFEPAHLAYLSCKKDAMANVGGVIAFDDGALLEPLVHEVIRQESYPSAGGLAARDLAAMAIGLEESVDDRVVASHLGKVRWLADRLAASGVSVGAPVGAHGVVILPPGDRPHAPHALAAEIYLEGGVRAAVFGDSVRLALPRRVYTHDHLERVAAVVGRAFQRPHLKLRCVHSPAEFFNFFARFAAESGGDHAT